MEPARVGGIDRVGVGSDLTERPRKTIRSWGQAILSRHPEHLARVLLGRGVNQKRTPGIDHYVARRWAELIAEGHPNYRAILIREVPGIFEVKLSGETLRQITLELSANHEETKELARLRNAAKRHDTYRRLRGTGKFF